MLEQCGGQLRTAGAAGVPIGLDLPAALALGAALGYDATALALLLPSGEGGMIRGIAKLREERE